MKIKICGLKYPDNIEKVAQFHPDYLGFIFYEKSPRCVEKNALEEIKKIQKSKKIGVFVNEKIENIIKIYKDFELDYVQIHGDEDLEFSKKLAAFHIPIIKVFRLKTLSDSWQHFIPYTHFFLFDTPTSTYGGSGKKFDWNVLTNVAFPFFLSGGIGVQDIEAIKKLPNKYLHALDTNSQLESAPGMKDLNKVAEIMEKI